MNELASISKKNMSVIFASLSAITLTIWLSLVDPINSPKFWVLLLTSAWILGQLVFRYKFFLSDPVLKKTLIVSGLFLLALTADVIATDMKFTGLFGESQRKTGYFTYTSLVIFFAAGALFMRSEFLKKFQKFFFFTAAIFGGYGMVQHLGHDPIKWNNPYNALISTVGNPDFASAVMAILFVIAFSIFVSKNHTIWFRVANLLLAVILVAGMKFSQSLQGLLAASIGSSIVVLVMVNQKNRKLGRGLALLAIPVFLTGVLGILNHGPLSFLWKQSVSIRGNYFRAGWNMFKSHPIFGVGLDRYGANFRQYRDAKQVLMNGPTVTSNAAHDVPIQFAATGGILLFVTYLLILAFVVWRGLVALRQRGGTEQIAAAGIFGAWIAYQAQSLVSIDNIGISIWGWVLGGLIVGLSVVRPPALPEKKAIKLKKRSSAQTSSLEIKSGLTSALLVLLPLILVVEFYGGEISSRYAQSFAQPTTQAQLPQFEKNYLATLKYIPVDPRYRVWAGTALFKVSLPSGEAQLKLALKNDPKNYDAKDILAQLYESMKKYPDAIIYRKLMMAQDPFNYQNMLSLGRDFKASGDVTGAKAMAAKIVAIAPASPEATTAVQEFGK